MDNKPVINEYPNILIFMEMKIKGKEFKTVSSINLEDISEEGIFKNLRGKIGEPYRRMLLAAVKAKKEQEAML